MRGHQLSTSKRNWECWAFLKCGIKKMMSSFNRLYISCCFYVGCERIPAGPEFAADIGTQV